MVTLLLAALLAVALLFTVFVLALPVGLLWDAIGPWPTVGVIAALLIGVPWLRRAWRRQQQREQDQQMLGRIRALRQRPAQLAGELDLPIGPLEAPMIPTEPCAACSDSLDAQRRDRWRRALELALLAAQVRVIALQHRELYLIERADRGDEYAAAFHRAAHDQQRWAPALPAWWWQRTARRTVADHSHLLGR